MLIAAAVCYCSIDDKIVPARGRAVLRTGLQIAIPPGTYARIAPRSGLAVKNGITTGAGVVDEDYRGEVGVVLFNLSDNDFEGALLHSLFLMVASYVLHSSCRENGPCLKVKVLEQRFWIPHTPLGPSDIHLTVTYFWLEVRLVEVGGHLPHSALHAQLERTRV